ncbi:MAG: rod shape-determining protein MreD [Pseudomonadales bacterium]|nr:rod shape-determining protein MreD [Pseudomonadales bacterium]MDP6316011.1 rod shape-determining protein MreD [Pseudomonadales bacterium]MDP7313993.1 rod shape-determining protein MreD [Pseudomonadales bacterium]MDP7577034.1 rod shape-determining protein MreD [Pseudomonadales bacterium]|tara:strand:+ start:505 stop:1014 length:510 start_codon:yes stop_codon:yes gene_type:complete
MEAVVDDRGNSLWVIAMTFVIAMLLSVVSLPEFIPWELGYLRPQWVVLVLIYWIIALPHRIGVAVAWLIGLLVDVLLGSLLGQHGIAFIVVAYISSSLYQRLRMFAVWQQSLVVFATIGLSQLINSWIENIAGLSEWNMWYLVPAFVSALLWPWIFLVLRFLRRFFNVT